MDTSQLVISFGLGVGTALLITQYLGQKTSDTRANSNKATTETSARDKTRKSTTAKGEQKEEVSKDEKEENQRVTKAQATQEAKTLLISTLNGVFSTLSRRDGSPFGSVAPYAIDAQGNLLLYIASIAEHTRNVKADSRASFLIHDEVPSGKDIQTKSRLCIMGEMSRVSSDEKADSWARYVARVAAARGYEGMKTHGFSLWKLEPKRFRWIGGFGEIFWLDASDFKRTKEEDPVWVGRQRPVDHMNDDHLDATRDFYRAANQTPTDMARMVSVDTFGMDFNDPGEAGAGMLRVDFPEPTDTKKLRHDVVKALKVVKAKLKDQEKFETKV